MNRTLASATALVAVLVIAVFTYTLLSTSPSVVSRSPAPASPSAEPLPPSSASPAALHEGPLSKGRYVFEASREATVHITADVPAGWNGWPTQGVRSPGTLDQPPVSVAFQRAAGLFRDPCQWDSADTGQVNQRGNVQVGPAAIDLVKALGEQPALQSTTPTPVVLGGNPGYELEIEFPADVSLETCDAYIVGGSHYVEVFSGADVFPYFFNEGSRMRLVIADVLGTRIIATIIYAADAPAAEMEAARAIVESVEFGP